jgi:hypothetical protein
MAEQCMVNHELEQGLVLTALERVSYLREQMEEAVRLIVDDYPQKARWVLDEALEKTDVGTMDVVRPGEEPF